MMCYRDRSYCSNAEECTQMNGKCIYVLTPSEAKRAEILELPIAWMDFKSFCTDYKEKEKEGT